MEACPNRLVECFLANRNALSVDRHGGETRQASLPRVFAIPLDLFGNVDVGYAGFQPLGLLSIGSDEIDQAFEIPVAIVLDQPRLPGAEASRISCAFHEFHGPYRVLITSRCA